jgi:hypothetical protein
MTGYISCMLYSIEFVAEPACYMHSHMIRTQDDKNRMRIYWMPRPQTATSAIS